VRLIVECLYRSVRALNDQNLFFPYVQPNLCGACGVASEALHTLLERHGHKSELLAGMLDSRDWHCWVELDGWVLDVTGEQFGFDPVQILEQRPGRYREVVSWKPHAPTGSVYEHDIKEILKLAQEYIDERR